MSRFFGEGHGNRDEVTRTLHHLGEDNIGRAAHEHDGCELADGGVEGVTHDRAGEAL